MSVKTFKNIIVKKTSGGGAVDPYKTIENETLTSLIDINLDNYKNHKDIAIYDEDITNLAPFAFLNHSYTIDKTTDTDTNTGQTFNIKELNLPNATTIGYLACANILKYTGVFKARGVNFVKVSLPKIELLEARSFENISPSSASSGEAYFIVGPNLKYIGYGAFNQTETPNAENGYGLYRYNAGQFFTTNTPMTELKYIGEYAFYHSSFNKGGAKNNGFNLVNVSDNLEYIGNYAFAGDETLTSSSRNGANIFIPTTGKTLTLSTLGEQAFRGCTFYNNPTEWGTPGTLTIKCKETSPLVSANFNAKALFSSCLNVPNVIIDLTHLGASFSCSNIYDKNTSASCFASNCEGLTIRVDPSLNTGKEKRVTFYWSYSSYSYDKYTDFVVLGDSGYIVVNFSDAFYRVLSNSNFARFDKYFRCFNDDAKTTHDNKLIMAGDGFKDFKVLTHFRNNHFKAILCNTWRQNTYTSGQFQNCTGLISVKLQGLTKMTSLNTYDIEANYWDRLNVLVYTFYGDTSLKQVDLGYCASIGQGAFTNCNAMAKLVIRNEDVIPEVYNSTKIGLPTTCTIYVPSSMISLYQADSYFSQFTIDSIDNYVDDYESED